MSFSLTIVSLKVVFFMAIYRCPTYPASILEKINDRQPFSLCKNAFLPSDRKLVGRIGRPVLYWFTDDVVYLIQSSWYIPVSDISRDLMGTLH